jgi:cytochrome c-type biogenesis protein CcmH
VSDDEVNKVAKGLYCPVCQNVPLEVCETEACARWREQVRELIAQGDTQDQIRQYFIQRFGPQTVGTPTNPTAQLLTQTLPYLLIGVVGGVVIGLSLMAWRRRQVIASGEISPPQMADRPAELSESDAYRARLEREVKERD